MRVWAFTNKDHTLKYALPSIGGEIEDIAWDEESKRLLAVGGGAHKAKFFMWDTGSQLGEVIPSSKKVLTCDIKPSRPARAVFGGEEFSLNFYAGPPFKYDKGLKDHTNFVNCVRYSPDGTRFISVSSDKQAIVYDGTTGEVVGKLDTASQHAGGIYAVAWSPDGTRVATCSGDKSVKTWDMTATVSGGGAGASASSFPCLSTLSIGKAIDDMQVGLVWPAPDLIVSLSLDGTLNYINPADTAATEPQARVRGHQAPATVFDYDQATGRIYSADAAGRTCVWSPSDEARTTYVASVATGEVATKKASAIAVRGAELAVGAWDDKLRVGDAATGELKATIALPGQPKGIAIHPANPAIKFVATTSAIVIVSGSAVSGAPIAAPWNPTCIDISADGSILAVGGKDKKVHVYKVAAADGALTPDGETAEFGAEISVVGISPDGKQIAAGDGLREVRLYGSGEGKPGIRVSRWMNHTTRVTGLKWSPDGRHIATVSTDRRLCVWVPEADAPKVSIDLAYPQPYAGVTWADNNTIWTLGTDGVMVRKVLAL